MINHKINIPGQEQILRLIKELEQNPRTTQRHLSESLGLSLGNVNFLLKMLIDEGIIEAKNSRNSKNKPGYVYLLTPYGIETKLELVRKFFVRKTGECEKLKREIEELRREAGVAQEDFIESSDQSFGAENASDNVLSIQEKKE